MLGDQYQWYVDLLQKNHVTKQLIAPGSNAEEFKKKFAAEKGTELRTMDIGLTSPTYVRITPEIVSTEIYTQDRDVTVIQIRNRAIAKGYMEHFGILWKHAKEYSRPGQK